MDAFDADCLIYAAAPDHPMGALIRGLFTTAGDEPVGLGSVVLIPELLSKPLATGDTGQLTRLAALLARVELHAADQETAYLSARLGATHRLKAADALHLATAIQHGAARFITNNRRDFRPTEIAEIDVVHPDQL